MQSLAAYAAPFGSRGPTCSCLRPNPSDLQKVGPTRIPIDVDRAHMSGRIYQIVLSGVTDHPTVLRLSRAGWMDGWAHGHAKSIADGAMNF
uniref:Uncharacterized protein n=1 Tax=Oryza barthii TaxID=65489 RepID=A0A0D3HEZ1_9ORYZ